MTTIHRSGSDPADAVGTETAENASTMVAQFSHAKLPVRTSHSWVAMTRAAATVPTIAGAGPATQSPRTGANRNQGTISCATWLPSTSPRWNQSGSRCACRLNGPGIGCVSW